MMSSDHQRNWKGYILKFISLALLTMTQLFISMLLGSMWKREPSTSSLKCSLQAPWESNFSFPPFSSFLETKKEREKRSVSHTCNEYIYSEYILIKILNSGIGADTSGWTFERWRIGPAKYCKALFICMVMIPQWSIEISSVTTSLSMAILGK